MHYMYAIIFPFEENGIKYSDIEAYFDNNGYLKNKHNATVTLVIKKHFSISSHYKQLKDAAQAARYHDFSQPPQVVQTLRNKLNKVIEYAESKFAERYPNTGNSEADGDKTTRSAETQVQEKKSKKPPPKQ